MVKPREAKPQDAAMLARLHVQAWQETYPGLLPEAEIAARTVEDRQALWARVLASGQSRVWLIDDLGFANFGPQRERCWADDGYQEELYAMYLIKDGYGLGPSLMTAAYGTGGQPFTTCVLDDNARACAFYEKAGGAHLVTRKEKIGDTDVVERVYGWTRPPFTD